MRRPFFLIIFILILNNGYSQNSEYKLDYTNPISVVNGLLHASKTKNLELLFLVLDPFIKSGEMYKLKMLLYSNDADMINDFFQMRFSYINGNFTLSKYSDNGYVPLWLNQNGKERQETIILRKRYGNWYIVGF